MILNVKNFLSVKDRILSSKTDYGLFVRANVRKM
ncbi:hypothetical protein QFZ80_000085 [Paenibacillus sp. V4I7]|nr:hypothetical protein [Paenibacillus sp. V4I7]MDQ0913815.1 hypothetical protein [Paenibacillus sp. V4I5]